MISIIIPAYNVENYIEECLDSIQNQSFSDFEVFVVDDGSSDKTPDLIERYSKTDERFHLIRSEHSNAGHARNVGMQSAQGDYLLFFDADDYMLPTTLSTMIGYAKDCEADITIVNCEEFNDDTKEVSTKRIEAFGVEKNMVFAPEEIAKDLFGFFMGWPWNKLFRTDFIKQHQLQYQSIESTNDAYFVFSALMLAEKISYVDKPLIRHRKRGGSIEQTRDRYPHNAKLAVDAIEEQIEKMENGHLFRNSFNFWALAHLRWNALSLKQDDSITEALDDYAAFAKSLKDADLSPLYPVDRRITTDLSTGRNVAACYVNAVAGIDQMQAAHNQERTEMQGRITHLTTELENRDKTITATTQRNSELANQNAQLTSELNYTRARIAELENSTTYKAGKVLLALPCKIKDSLGK